MAGKGKKPVTSGEMRELAAQLKARSQLIAKMANTMDRQEREAMDVMGEPMAQRALKFVDSFIHSCRRELGEL